MRASEDWHQREIGALRERVVRNKALTSSRRDAAFLVRFLRAREFDCERLYAMLESYCRVRAQHAEVFHQLTPSSVEHVWNDDVAQVLQKPDKIVLKNRLLASRKMAARHVLDV